MKVSTFSTSEKQSQTLELLKYGTVMSFVDSRHPGVVVPEFLKGDYQLRLNFDYAFEIDDFRVLPDRLEASLSFNHKNFFCVIPFEAVYLILNNAIQRACLFIESVPSEMLEILTATEKPEEARVKLKNVSPAPQPQGAQAQPQVVPTVSPEANGDTVPQASAPDKPKKRGSHLRLVK